ncbi:hypothetical protein RDV64_04695 [Acuticoccus sp. MNP-M23]|uniref:hypothetical protein n=1 Tax=Acuticoccus sp. MNP-M23 TaxID=3072793 RepID=UPI002815D0F6|nr:hypothetical protein [Acuticoccus sp. MNP-M23]WMS43704.1 hypothetical protein RDV64_04695 [Acuticoccus sp. MNP-M23]
MNVVNAARSALAIVAVTAVLIAAFMVGTVVAICLAIVGGAAMLLSPRREEEPVRARVHATQRRPATIIDGEYEIVSGHHRQD